ncbi:formate dehydrogenase subunit delta [Kribbella solani]|uniref:formate dehydrogenase subunit delta n=1 Tax=Kribbella solani TaxID=236067 RepID=UPI0029BA7580|nr:formate dehydrogenase subunit delta [Kribbella solani]MDX2968748.1 formate dehydrogenase subunit delta [Kribbella solani]MDX3005968.1 formate dehydrogenase subunit delta [Kribbella solani]
MSSGVPPYVRLANEIAAQFAHRAPAEAATAIANHMRVTWDPRMKSALIEYARSGGPDLAPAAAQAAHHLQAGS